MQHHFNTDIAKKYDIVTAILMDNFYYWIEKNRANNRNFKNDRYWTYNSKKAMAQLFPYLTERQLDYSLQKMKNNGLIMTANYNTDKYDKTLWYAITDFGYSILQNCEMYNIYNITNTNTNTNKEIYKEKENSCANAQKLAKEVCTPTDLRSTNETTDTNLPYLQKEKDSKVMVDSEEVINYLNEKANTHFRFAKSNLKFVNARLSEFSVADLKMVIDYMCKKWLGTNMEEYLRPETLFNATKFENYYNEALKKITQQQEHTVKQVNGVWKI